MTVGREALRVPLGGGIEMQLRGSELASVAAGFGGFDAFEEGQQLRLAEALHKLPTLDRASFWELAVRRYGRGKPLAQAAGEIGMDVLHANALVTGFLHALGSVPAPEHSPNL